MFGVDPKGCATSQLQGIDVAEQVRFETTRERRKGVLRDMLAGAVGAAAGALAGGLSFRSAGLAAIGAAIFLAVIERHKLRSSPGVPVS